MCGALSAGRGSVVSVLPASGGGLVVVVVTAVAHCRAGVASLVAHAVICGVVERSGFCRLLGVLLATESGFLRAGGIIVAWAGTIALLLLVVAHEHDLQGCGDEEEDRSDDSACEADFLEFASKAKMY